MRVLVLEDEPRLSRSYAKQLRAEGLAVDEVRTLHAARHALADVEYDGMVLDRGVPDGDGLDLLAELAPRRVRISVVVVSARGEADERVKGLEAGADDYIAKPVRLDELAVRVCKLLVRRSSDQLGPVQLGRVVIDRDHRRVTLDGSEVHLTRTQMCVLEQLVANRERVVGSDELLEHCWDDRRDAFANPLHSQITRLRSIFKGALRIEWSDKGGYLLSAFDDGR